MSMTAEKLLEELDHQLGRIRQASKEELDTEIERTKAVCQISGQIIDLAKEQTRFIGEWGGQHTLFKGQPLQSQPKLLKGI